MKRFAKINLKYRILSYLYRHKYDELCAYLPIKKIANPESEEVLLKEIVFYAKYCLENTANMDDTFEKLVKKILKAAQLRNKVGLRASLKELQ